MTWKEEIVIIRISARRLKAMVNGAPETEGSRKSESISYCEAILDRCVALEPELEKMFPPEVTE